MIEFEKYTRVRYRDFIINKYGDITSRTYDEYWSEYAEWMGLNYAQLRKDFEEYLKTFEVKPPY